MSAKIIAVVGATGNQGGSVLKTFASSDKYKVRALTHNPNSEFVAKPKSKYPNIEWMKVDINNADTLRKAFSGVYAVFGVTQFAKPDVLKMVDSGNLDAEFNQGKNIIDAAIAENVKVAIMSTLHSLAEESKGKFTKVLHFEGKYKIAQYLDSKADRIKRVNLYLGSYMENYVTYPRISPEYGETIEFVYPLKPTTLFPQVDAAKDTGPVVGYALEHADKYQGKPIRVSSGAYEVEEMVNTFTEVTGKLARFVQIPYEAVGMKGLSQMFQFIDESKDYASYDFEEQNIHINHHFTTPVEFWKNRGWTGPSK